MKNIMLAVLILAISACATYRPIVDMKGVDQGRYEADLKECQVYAEQVSPAGHAAVGAGIGAGIGAVLGAIIGSFFGEAGRGAGMGAALGGAQGAIGGGAEGAQGQVNIIRNCMAGRGYRVLR